MGTKLKRDSLLLVWLAAGFLLMLFLFAKALSATGNARLIWAIAVFLFIVLQSLAELMAFNHWYPEQREQNADWALLLPIIAVVWLVMQQLIAGSFSGI